MEKEIINNLFLSACRAGNLKLAKTCVNLGTTDFYNGFICACESGNLDLVKFCIEASIEFALSSGIKPESGEIVNFADGFSIACYKGYLEIAKLCIALNKGTDTTSCAITSKSATDFNFGMYSACSGGHLELVQLCIENGANDFNEALTGACEGNNLELVKFCVDHAGFNKPKGLLEPIDFDRGIRYADYNDSQKELFNLYKENGLDIFESEPFYSERLKKLEIIEYLKEKKKIK